MTGSNEKVIISVSMALCQMISKMDRTIKKKEITKAFSKTTRNTVWVHSLSPINMLSKAIGGKIPFIAAV